MFVRWKRRKLKGKLSRGDDPGYALDAVLVESVRINGKPRQKFLAHLATIEERLLHQTVARFCFWRNVHFSLQPLAIDVETIEKINAALLSIVPRPSSAETEKAQAEVRSLEKQLRTHTGMPL